jgi:hypothetical protein
MTATPDEIPTDLTLEIDANISPERFLAAAKAFFGYVQDLTQSVAPEGEARWVVRVREGSQLLGLEPAKGVPENAADLIYSRAAASLKSLAEGDLEDAEIPSEALKHLRTLTEIAEGTGKRAPVPMRMWVRRKPIDFGPAMAQIIREELSPDYRDYGTIEGRLEAIQESYGGGLQFQIRDALLHQKVRCYFPEEMLPEVFKDFRKRVEVAGVIYYRKGGIPVSITAEKLIAFPDDSELPTARDVRGILANKKWL